jgi:quinol monooxygenase YgiN
MILSSLKVYPGSDGRKDVLDILRSLEWSLKTTPGCLESSYSTGRRGDSEYIVMIALWQSEADLARFIRSGPFDRVMTVMELSKSPPEIRFHEIGHTRGMEYIESVRSAVPEGGA